MQKIIDTGPTSTEFVKNGFDDCNTNFTELYTDVSNIGDEITELAGQIGPCFGTKYAEFRKAIKYIQVNIMQSGDLYYVGKIVNGTGTAPNLTYTVEIWKTANFTAAGTKVMAFTYTGIALSGLTYFGIPPYNNSGRNCWFGINWTLLISSGHALGTTFTCANFAEGGLFAVNVMPLPGTPGGGGGAVTSDMIEEVTEDSSVFHGDKILEILNPSGPINVYLAKYDDLKGSVKGSNISAYTVVILPDATESTKTFNGIANGIEIHAGENFEIQPYGGNYILSQGNFHAI